MKTLRKNLLLSTLITTLAATSSISVSAQDNDVEDELIVTGSRINNIPNLVQASQIQSITSEESDLRNVASVELLIRDLPGVVASIGSSVNNGNGGAQTINLRGIGSNRNLVLLDGQRIVPFGLTGVTDTNNLPLALIERTDIVTGGASTVYGADAVSGVLNFITKDDFEGFEVTTTYGGTEQGDGETFRVEATTGANFDDGRGNAVFSLGYQDSNPVLQGDRPFSEFVIDSEDGSQGGSSNSAPFLFTTGSGPNGIAFGNQFNPDTGLLEPGFTPFNFAPLNLLQTPVERFNIFGSTSYEITDNIEVYTKAFFTQTNVGTTLAPSAAFFVPVELPISNPFLTDGVRDQICFANDISVADCLAADSITDPNAPGFQSVVGNLQRRFVEAGPRTNDFESNVFQFSGGFRGDILDTGWAYDISAQFGESVQVQTSGSFGLFDNLQQGLFAIDENTCVDPSGGCVPLNLFNEIGTFTEEQFAFVDVEASTTTAVTQTVLQANFSGDLGGFTSPWADDVIGVAIGGEYRELTADSSGDFLSQQPGALLGAGGADPAVAGRFDVIEGYVEAIAPLATGLPLAENVSLELGARVSDYSTSGTSLTWKVGGNWEPTEGYRIRSVFQRAVRSPNIGELFFPIQSGLGNLAVDPCQGADVVAGSALADICIAQGAPAAQIGFIAAPAASQVTTFGGGNPDLDVETASTFTIGLVAQPTFVDNLTVSVDYFQIRVADAISSPAESDIINGCFDTALNPNLDFNNFCGSIIRDPLSGSLNFPALLGNGGINLALTNAGEIFTNGFDLGIDYGHDLNSWGDLSYSFDGTLTLANDFQATPSTIDRDCAGIFSPNCGSIQSEVAFNQRVTWNKDIWGVSVRHRFLSGNDFEADALEFDGDGNPSVLPEFQEIDAEHYFDGTIVADLTDFAQLSLTINNIFDNQPPEVGSDVGTTAFNTGNTFPSTFDALGRSYTAGLRLKF